MEARADWIGFVLGLRNHGILVVGHNRGDVGNGSVISESATWSSFCCRGF